MAEIKLYNSESVAIVDDCDIHIVDKYKWHECRGRNTKYAAAWHSGTRVLMHRILLSASGRNTHVDHKNGDGLDNRRVNIRLCTPSQNNKNRGVYKNNKEGLKGVTKASGGKFMARITTQIGIIYLGSFGTAESAARAYDSAARRYHGDFANLNFKD